MDAASDAEALIATRRDPKSCAVFYWRRDQRVRRVETVRDPAVIATPHVASFTPRTSARMANAAMENMLAVLRGERPASIANPAVYERGIRPR